MEMQTFVSPITISLSEDLDFRVTSWRGSMKMCEQFTELIVSFFGQVVSFFIEMVVLSLPNKIPRLRYNLINIKANFIEVETALIKFNVKSIRIL
jgi:spore maturation protein SpmA